MYCLYNILFRVLILFGLLINVEGVVNFIEIVISRLFFFFVLRGMIYFKEKREEGCY